MKRLMEGFGSWYAVNIWENFNVKFEEIMLNFNKQIFE